MEQHPKVEVQLQLDDQGRGRFFIDQDGALAGEMVLSVAGEILTVYHTEVQSAFEGKGLAGQLLDAMVAYARSHHLKVRPLCPYVQAQFRRHPDQYKDIWLQDTVQ